MVLSLNSGVAYQSSNRVLNADNLNFERICQAQLVLVLLIPRCLRERLPVRILTIGSPHLQKVRHVYCR